jgi:N6-L-threonylcarbamoyladenine synthase
MGSLVLGLESSCDETAAAVVLDGRKVLSNVVASQMDLHQRYGGVVPEVASRRHLEILPSLVTETLANADIPFDRLTGLAVTTEPGLIGALLTGVSFAKGLALRLGLPLAAVNHLEAHLYASELDAPPVEFPALGLVVSGGHTEIYVMEGWGAYRLWAATRDDAAGEAFDKVAKLLGLGYPGGPIIEQLSAPVRKDAGRFPLVRFKDGSQDLSFSGLKTAVRNVVAAGPMTEVEKTLLAAKFQNTVVEELRIRVRSALMQTRPKSLLVGGGVACNGPIREALSEEAKAFSVAFRLPPPKYCGDNAAMVAGLGSLWLSMGRVADLSVSARPSGSLCL